MNLFVLKAELVSDDLKFLIFEFDVAIVLFGWSNDAHIY